MVTAAHVSPTDTAKLLRQHLRRAFPDIKFGVRTRKYAGGASIDVTWTDGPVEHEVRKVTELYRGADFDGMTDCKTHRQSVAMVDGEPQHVSYMADFIFTRRTISDEFMGVAADFIARNAASRSGGNNDCDSPGCVKIVRDNEPIYLARERNGLRRLCCSPECAASVEIRYGHIRPGRGVKR